MRIENTETGDICIAPDTKEESASITDVADYICESLRAHTPEDQLQIANNVITRIMLNNNMESSIMRLNCPRHGVTLLITTHIAVKT